MTTDTLSAEIRQRHVRVPSMDPTAFLCDECVEPWPCDAIRAADALDALTAERDALLAEIEDRHNVHMAYMDQPVKLHECEIERDRLQASLDAAIQGRPPGPPNPFPRESYTKLIAERDRLRRREQKYRETLEWYGGQEAWKHHRVPGTYTSYYQEIDRDKGARARAALAPEPEQEATP